MRGLLNLHCPFASVVAKAAIPFSNLPAPVVQDGKTTATISEEGYQSDLDKSKNMLRERLQLNAKEKPYTPADLEKKLAILCCGLGSWSIIPIAHMQMFLHVQFCFRVSLSTVLG
ncbi:hypothetical protein ACFX1S_040184 [Malus domestica]